MAFSLVHMDRQQFAAVRPQDVRRTGKAGIEAVERTQDFQRLLGHIHLRAEQGGLIRAELAAVAARCGVPCGRDDTLVDVHLFVFDDRPVPERLLVKTAVLSPFLRFVMSLSKKTCMVSAAQCASCALVRMRPIVDCSDVTGAPIRAHRSSTRATMSGCLSW